MPLYTVKCEKHGKQEIFRPKCEKVCKAPCPVCGEDSLRDWTDIGMPEPFLPYWTQSLSLKPVYISSRKQEKAIEKKHHLQRVY